MLTIKNKEKLLQHVFVIDGKHQYKFEAINATVKVYDLNGKHDDLYKIYVNVVASTDHSIVGKRTELVLERNPVNIKTQYQLSNKDMTMSTMIRTNQIEDITEFKACIQFFITHLNHM